MSNNSKEMRKKLGEINRLQEELILMLIDNPSADNDSKKEEMYQMAICYYEAKRRRSQREGKGFYNGAYTINLFLLIENYHKAQGEAKNEYARKIARNISNTSRYWLKMLPNEIMEEAFKIIIDYLEEQKNS